MSIAPTYEALNERGAKYGCDVIWSSVNASSSSCDTDQSGENHYQFNQATLQAWGSWDGAKIYLYGGNDTSNLVPLKSMATLANIELSNPSSGGATMVAVLELPVRYLQPVITSTSASTSLTIVLTGTY